MTSTNCHFQLGALQRAIPRLALAAAVVLAPSWTVSAQPTPPPATPSIARDATELGIRDGRFTLQKEPTFLLGISYYGALGASRKFIQQDLDDLQRHGFNWLRVWATWNAFDHDVSAVDQRGQPRPTYLEKLRWLVAECDRRGLVVDVTLTRGKSLLPNHASHREAVATIVKALASHRNWYLDLANERDVRDDRYASIAELKQLRDLVRELDPSRLVTASFGGHDLSERDVREALLDAGQDFLSVHRPRHAGSAEQTRDRTQKLLKVVASLERTAPVHHQEPFRRGYGRWEPVAADFLTDLKGAVEGGAAGWCFHNGGQRNAPGESPRRSFDLCQQRLIDQLDAEEQVVLTKAAAIVKTGAKHAP
ncbi:MAG: hypothetical protein KDB14_31800 [Planctomycetales bacterium]|nr:hypothetical protein [Planctomycetales bacterium]